MDTKKAFKVCSTCGQVWQSRDDFLNDTSLKLNGYKADFERLEYGMFFITHGADGCHSTLAFEVNDFNDLYTGVRYTERKTLGPDCPRYCVDEKQLARCDAMCECAFVREIAQLILKRQSGDGADVVIKR
ncbi:MAG: hypothetical protein HY751_08280 [Nitrospinae bacterium]|nr:hypothetical protein [Nitrospinota bacterium]